MKNKIPAHKKRARRRSFGLPLAALLVIFVVLPIIFLMLFANLSPVRTRRNVRAVGFMAQTTGAPSRRIPGMSREEVQRKLGAPTLVSFDSPFDSSRSGTTVSYRMRGWRHLIIEFDENDIATWVGVGNPAHVGLGG
ncbi:MAG: outer membrane protein assembly factor BamE [Defluviitaleaceae bacterium]|nr:outer membrane protein assembly factor BamE [Defluviitaleaceae bacterium]